MTWVAITIVVALGLAVAGCSRPSKATRAAGTASVSPAPTQVQTAVAAHSEATGLQDSWPFVAKPDELSRAFPGWARPLPLLDQFVVRTERNPFTGHSR